MHALPNHTQGAGGGRIVETLILLASSCLKIPPIKTRSRPNLNRYFYKNDKITSQGHPFFFTCVTYLGARYNARYLKNFVSIAWREMLCFKIYTVCPMILACTDRTWNLEQSVCKSFFAIELTRMYMQENFSWSFDALFLPQKEQSHCFLLSISSVGLFLWFKTAFVCC